MTNEGYVRMLQQFVAQNMLIVAVEEIEPDIGLRFSDFLK